MSSHEEPIVGMATAPASCPSKPCTWQLWGTTCAGCAPSSGEASSGFVETQGPNPAFPLSQ